MIRFLLVMLLLLIGGTHSSFAQGSIAPAEPHYHRVDAGDTWTALSWRYQVAESELRAANPHPNPYRQPTIGSTAQIPNLGADDGELREQAGVLRRSGGGGLLQLAAVYRVNPWVLARLNGIPHPARALQSRTLFIPGSSAPPSELPPGFLSLELSAVPAQPGRALAIRATTTQPREVSVTLDETPWDVFANGPQLIALGGTGAFFRPGEPTLTIVQDDGSRWSQPWRFEAGTWDFDQVTLSGAAAAIDQAAIQAERERLFQIWSQRFPAPQWQGAFGEPLANYLHVSSTYGARRSYNGGPYSTYHEGVDFAAYGGTPVHAPAAGTVVLAEELYVRGGAVILDHGLGIFSGYYHMSAVHAQAGQTVQAGALLGEVGTTGLSSGNHLHWDLLVAETWVDAAAWRQDEMECWILAGWGTPCPG